MPLKQTIDFSTANPAATDNFSLPLYQQCGFVPSMGSWKIGAVNGFFRFNLSLAQSQGVNLILQLCSGLANGTTNCPINITVNGQLLVAGFDPHITQYYNMVWSIPASMLHAGNNDITVTLSGGSTVVFLKYAIVDLARATDSAAKWMQNLPDSLPLCDINIPGTHDAAAINSTIHTPYACHRFSINEQLNGGVRLLDIRLKVKKNNNAYQFVTCHGDIGSSSGVNEYEPFQSVMDTCKTFLSANSSETVLMSLKVDDWNGFQSDAANVKAALKSFLQTYPVYASSSMPTLSTVRGKLYLINRIDSTLDFGAPIGWQDNTSGSFAYGSSNRSFQVYVQDQYKGLPTFGADSYKYRLVTAAFAQKQPNMAVLNFASATWFGVIGVYIMGELLGYFGANAAPNRPGKFGWTLFDYEFEKYQTDTYGWLDIVQLVISSNSSYASYPNTFKVLGHDEL